MKKIIIAFAFFIVLFPQKVFATDPNFDISVNSNYNVHDDGITTIKQNITIKNKSDFYFTPTYTVSIGFRDIENIQAYSSDGSIPFTLDDKDPKNKSIKMTFSKRYTGQGNVNNFSLQFDTKDIARKQGNVWEVSIPGIAEISDFASYDTSITVPESFGSATIVKPKTKILQNDITFNKDEVGKAGVFLIYGKSQFYSFNLKYNISNKNLFPVRTEIALPPQTNYQNVLINSLNPKPVNVTRDTDGNWIAEYRLLPEEKKIVTAMGIVEVSSDLQNDYLSNDVLSAYTQPKKNWESNNELISKVAKTVNTPLGIYDFVVKTLKYNYEKVSDGNKRLGGVGALQNSANSVCLEFTDLFISLARSAGIPARAVEGFAYTENDKLRPLSLVSDVLHAWPEYFDRQNNRWVMVDPTWGNTTKGMDYFNTLDFEHVAFVIKGVDSEYPIPAGGYKFDSNSKDVDVKFANAKDFIPDQKITITDTFPKNAFPGFSLEGDFKVQNTGNTPIANLTAIVQTKKGQIRQFDIDYIPPYGYKRIPVKITDLPFLTNGAYPITIQIGKDVYTKKVAISLIPDLGFVLIIGGIIGGAVAIAAVTYNTGSILVQRRKRKHHIRGKGQRP